MSESWVARGTPELTPAGKQPLLTNIFQCSAEFLEQLRFYLEQNPPTIPISNIPGFTQFTAQAAQIATSETTTSTTYADLATVGPQLTGLPDGKYVLSFGAVANASTGANSAIMSPKVNSTEAVDSDATYTAAQSGTGIGRGVVATLSGGGNNTVTIRYKSNTGTPSGTFANRWLIAQRYANL